MPVAFDAGGLPNHAPPAVANPDATPYSNGCAALPHAAADGLAHAAA